MIGAGVTGLVAGRELAREGAHVAVYERWPGLGGQAATLDVGDGVLLERYYHHLFTSDREIASLYAELGIEDGIEWLRSSMAFFARGASHPFTTPGDVLRFKPLPFHVRVRMGLAVLWLQRRHTSVEPLEGITAREWIVRAMGVRAWDGLWGPLLRGKFGERAEEISMAWLWSKLTLRHQIKGEEAKGEVLGYPRGGFEPLFGALRDQIVQAGGYVLKDKPAARVEHDGARFAVTAGAPDSFRRGHDPRAFEVEDDPSPYDAVLATVPNGVFRELLGPDLAGRIGEAYLARLNRIEYHSAVCLLLELDRELSPFYWTNVTDPDLPFIGLVEQANLVGLERCGGRHFLYVANYVPAGDPLSEMSTDALLDHYEDGLRKVNHAFERSWVRRSWVFREPEAQPIVTVGYRERIPALDTGVPGLVLANTTQVYPEDRGTNYAVRLGRAAAGVVRQGLA